MILANVAWMLYHLDYRLEAYRALKRAYTIVNRVPTGHYYEVLYLYSVATASVDKFEIAKSVLELLISSLTSTGAPLLSDQFSAAHELLREVSRESKNYERKLLPMTRGYHVPICPSSQPLLDLQPLWDILGGDDRDVLVDSDSKHNRVQRKIAGDLCVPDTSAMLTQSFEPWKWRALRCSFGLVPDRRKLRSKAVYLTYVPCFATVSLLLLIKSDIDNAVSLPITWANALVRSACRILFPSVLAFALHRGCNFSLRRAIDIGLPSFCTAIASYLFANAEPHETEGITSQSETIKCIQRTHDLMDRKLNSFCYSSWAYVIAFMLSITLLQLFNRSIMERGTLEKIGILATEPLSVLGAYFIVRTNADFFLYAIWATKHALSITSRVELSTKSVAVTAAEDMRKNVLRIFSQHWSVQIMAIGSLQLLFCALAVFFMYTHGFPSPSAPKAWVTHLALPLLLTVGEFLIASTSVMSLQRGLPGRVFALIVALVMALGAASAALEGQAWDQYYTPAINFLIPIPLLCKLAHASQDLSLSRTMRIFLRLSQYLGWFVLTVYFVLTAMSCYTTPTHVAPLTTDCTFKENNMLLLSQN